MDALSPVIKRFMMYARVETRSHNFGPRETETSPSSEGQIELMDVLREEFNGLGVSSAGITELGDRSMVIDFPATPGNEDVPRVCLAAHVDTYYGMPGEAKPVIHDYTGGDIKLPENGVVIPAEQLAGLEDKRIITSDGTTLLGGDDKAGVASLVTLIESLLTGAYPHGPVTIWFCVDEEIGKLGIEHLPKDLAESFGMFLTVDGTRLGRLDTGCFHCRQIVLTMKGQDAHPGEYPHLLKPSHIAAVRFLNRMMNRYPSFKAGIDDKTAPFFYVADIKGNPSETVMVLAPRAFDAWVSNEMVETMFRIAWEEAAAWGCTVEVTKNVLACVNNVTAMKPEVLSVLRAAHEAAGVTVTEHMARGGTDGAMFNNVFPNVPTPNMGYGGDNLHGPMEFVVAEELEMVPGILIDILARFASMKTGVKFAAEATA